TKRKLLPALYSLTRERLLPVRFAVIGYARRGLTDDAFRAEMRAGCEEFARRRPVDAEVWDGFARNLFYQEGSYDDPNAFVALRERLEQVERQLGLPGNRVFYLSIPPSSFAIVVKNLGLSGLVPPPSAGPQARFSRVIIEKPFGTDLATAQKLNHDIHATLTEPQIYRIDHYLGKETVQNLLVF